MPLMNEKIEVRRFMDYLYSLRDSITMEATSSAAMALNIPTSSIEQHIREACENAIFGVLTFIDGVSSPDDFPPLEIRINGSELFNGDFLHDLYIELQP